MEFESEHYVNLFFSNNFLHDDDNIVNIGLPYPINKPSKNPNLDTIRKYTDDIEKYNCQLKTLSKEFNKIKDKVMNQTFSESCGIITKGLLNLCNSEKQQIPFECDYNPYYTGLLESLMLNEHYYLITAKQNFLRLNDIKKPWKVLKLNVNSNENITGISVCDDWILVKHEKDCNLVKIEDIESITSLWTRQFKKNCLDAALNKTKIGLISSDLKLRLYDIETNKKLPLFDTDLSVRLNVTNENSVVLLNQKSLKIFDLRSENPQIFDPKIKNACDCLCSFKINGNYVYLASRHHLILSDIRFLKNVEFCTHLMKNSPCYMDLMDNILCLSSQTNEKVLFTGKPVSSLPLAVPSISDTLNKCKLAKDILLKNHLEEYLGKSVGGIKLISENNEILLYSTTSQGDIFKQQIGTSIAENSVEFLYNWINKLPEPSRKLHLTDVANLSELRFTLNRNIDQKQLIKFRRSTRKMNLFLNNNKSKYHRKHLGELAANLSSLWDADEENEKEEEVIAPEVAPYEKVSTWIKSNYFLE